MNELGHSLLTLVYYHRYCVQTAALESLAVSYFDGILCPRADAYRPILTPKSVLPLFFVIGVIFAPIGGLLLWASSQVCNTSHRVSS